MPTNIAVQPYANRRVPPDVRRDWLQTEFQNIQRGMLRFNVRAVTSDTTVTASDDTITADATGGAITVTLPAPEQLQFLRVSVKRLNSGANAVTVSGTIDGGASYALAAQWKSVTVQSDGTRWLVLSSF